MNLESLAHRPCLGNYFPWRATLGYIFAIAGQNHITGLYIMCMTVLTYISTVNHVQICYLFYFLTCTEINHIHILLLVGIFIIKHARRERYTVHSAPRTELLLQGMHKNTRKRESATLHLNYSISVRSEVSDGH